MTRRGVARLALLAAVLIGASACTESAGAPSPSPSAVRSSALGPTELPTSPSASVSSTSSDNLPGPGVRIRTLLLSELDGAVVPTTFVLEDDTRGVSEAKFYLAAAKRTFLGSARAAPFYAAISVDPGRRTVEVRHEVNGERADVTATFTARAGLLESTSSPPASSSPLPPPIATVSVSTSAQLAAALRAARPGTLIRLADGEYLNSKGDRWHLAASGTAEDPITLSGTRNAILESDSPSGDYGMWITGSYWQVSGITVRNAGKGIVLDGSSHTVLDDVEVYNIGDEGVHFRKCSSYDVLRGSYIHDTGVQSPSYGEGVYVGSANSNWGQYGCRDGQDKSEQARIENNTFRHIAAEGADLKEGTESGVLAGNSFTDTGYAGQNSADSAVDVKGNNWMVYSNTVNAPSGADLDAFQAHSVYAGYGTANVFSANTVLGAWPGFGFGLYPRGANIVTCDNTAPDAKRGLVGDDGESVPCAS
jgi:hypothetical protein